MAAISWREPTTCKVFQVAWVAKLDANAAVTWKESVATGTPRSVQPTADGGYVVATDLASDSPGTQVTKLDMNGGVLWGMSYIGLQLNALTLAPDGGYVLAGRPGAWVMKLDAGGNVAWLTRSSQSDDVANSVRATPDGGYIVAGSGSASWVVKLDAGGALVWRRTFAGSVAATAAHPTADGGYLVVGYGIVNDFVYGARGVQVLKLSAVGDLLWERIYGGRFDAIAADVRPTADGGYLVAANRGVFGPTAAKVWLLKLDATGAIGGCANLGTPSASVVGTMVNWNASPAPVPIARTNSQPITLFVASTAATPVQECYHSTTGQTVVEFYNASLDHYFITWMTDEIALLDAGAQLKGWVRTGYAFPTYTAPQPGTSPVCRYYIPPALGDSHFFGRGTAECNATGQKNPSFCAGRSRVHADVLARGRRMSCQHHAHLSRVQQSFRRQPPIHEGQDRPRPDGARGLAGGGRWPRPGRDVRAELDCVRLRISRTGNSKATAMRKAFEWSGVGDFARRKMLAIRLATALSTLPLATACIAAAGDIDTTFASNGFYVYPRVATGFDQFNTSQIVVLSSGTLLALGGLRISGTGGTPWADAASFALTSGGTLDARYGQGGMLPEVPTASRFSTARELADGSVILAAQKQECPSPTICGTFQDPGPTYYLRRYLPDGTLDLTFGQAATGFTASHGGNAAILPDGTAIGLGVTYSIGFMLPQARPYAFDAVVIDANGRQNPGLAAQFRAQMVRCSPSGTVAPGSPEPVRGYTAPIVEPAPNDQIIFGYGSCMMRLNRDATLDMSFGAGGVSQVDNAGLSIWRALVLKDGSVLTFALLADGSSFRAVKRLPNGVADPAFGDNGVIARMELPFTLVAPGVAPIGGYYNLPNSRGLPALDAKDRVLIAGSRVDAATGKVGNYLARFDVQMRLDTSFGSSAPGLAPIDNSAIGPFVPFSAAIDDRDRIVLGGRLTTGNPSGPQPTAVEAVVRLQGDPP